MLLFRSEEHIHRWSEERAIPFGATMSVEQGWRLADAWYRDRLAPEWRRRTLEDAQQLFTEIGLTGPFWRLAL